MSFAYSKLVVGLAIAVSLALSACAREEVSSPATEHEPAQALQLDAAKVDGPFPQQFNQALKNLSDPDETVRRNAAQFIYKNFKLFPAPQHAIQPLGKSLLNKKIRTGSTTRIIVAQTLGLIARELGGSHSDKAVSKLVESVESNNDFDLVRASSAEALGVTRNANAIPPLEFAKDNDASILVQTAAEDALARLAREGITVAPASVPTSYSALSTQKQTSLNETSPELLDYLEKRLINLRAER